MQYNTIQYNIKYLYCAKILGRPKFSSAPIEKGVKQFLIN